MKPTQINAVGTVEFFTFPGDGVNNVKIKIVSDFGSNVKPEIKDHISNLQFGVFYEFMSNEMALAETGKVFRAGMNFGQRQAGMGGDDDRRDPPPPEPDPTPDEGLMKPIKDLEKLIEDNE
jgi:hypothetical protein